MLTEAQRAYVAGLQLLARRELAEAQVRERLARRQFEPDDIDAAIARLRLERALDDRRTALACARDEVSIRRRGRLRVLRRLQALGIDRELARDTVAEVFADLDEDAMIERAMESRLRQGASLDDPRILRRVQRYLLGQGFDASRIGTVLRRRSRSASVADT